MHQIAQQRQRRSDLGGIQGIRTARGIDQVAAAAERPGGVLFWAVADRASALLNRTLLPREMRPTRLMQVGLVFCSVFFIAISVVVLVTRVF